MEGFKMRKQYASPVIDLLDLYDRQDVLTASVGTVEDCYDDMSNIENFFGKEKIQ